MTAYAGFSLTMPLKNRLLEIAIGQAWRIDETARLLGNANTWFVDQETSQVSVANTDLVGALKALEDLPSSLTSVAILGSGATARTLAFATLLTFKDLSSLTVFSRRPEPAQAIAAIVSSTNRLAKFEWLPLEAAADFGGADFTVNTLPSSVASQVEIDQQFEESYVLDVTYDSEAASPAQNWPSSNRVNGRTMLVHQALEQLRLFGAFRDGNQNITVGQVTTAMLAAISEPPTL
jgi:shikimate dehydrogenase